MGERLRKLSSMEPSHLFASSIPACPAINEVRYIAICKALNHVTRAISDGVLQHLQTGLSGFSGEVMSRDSRQTR